MHWPRMTTRHLMAAAAVVAVACALLSGLARIEHFPWPLVNILAVTFGIYVAMAFGCGVVLNWIAPLGPRAGRPPDDPLSDQQVDPRAEVSTTGAFDFTTESQAP